jgi:hypothetical protein
VGASTSRNPKKSLHGLYGDNFTFMYTSIVDCICIPS